MVDSLSRQQICAGSEFKVDGVGTKNAPEKKLAVMPKGLVKKN